MARYKRYKFTQSARKHRIGKGRAIYVVDKAFADFVETPADTTKAPRKWYLGDDQRGIAMEIAGVELNDEDETYLVIHVNVLQNKLREMYEAGKAAAQRQGEDDG